MTAYTKQKEIIYISGPMEGVENYEENFRRAEDDLTEAGYKVVNPANIDVTGMSREEILKKDIRLLWGCDGIYMLKGWQQSRGANREYGFALGCGMPIMHEEAEGMGIMLEEGE